jgi:hypothetical protein
MLQFIRRLWLALFSPALLANIKIAIAAVNLLKDALASGKLDELVNATSTSLDNEALFWARRCVKYLTDWIVFGQSALSTLDKRRIINADFNAVPSPAKNAIFLRLAVQTLQDMTAKGRKTTIPEDRAIIFVQTVYSREKQRNENT